MVTIKTAPRWIECMSMSGNNTYYNGYNKIFEPNGCVTRTYLMQTEIVYRFRITVRMHSLRTPSQPTDRPPIRPLGRSRTCNTQSKYACCTRTAPSRWVLVHVIYIFSRKNQTKPNNTVFQEFCRRAHYCQMLIYNYVLNDEPAVIIIISNFDHLSYLYHDYKDLSNINNAKRNATKPRCLTHTHTFSSHS